MNFLIYPDWMSSFLPLILMVLLFGSSYGETMLQMYYVNQNCEGSPLLMMYTKEVDQYCFTEGNSQFTLECKDSKLGLITL